MRIRITNAAGNSMLLPWGMRLQDIQAPYNLPTQKVYGRSGQVITGRHTAEPATVTIDGELWVRGNKETRDQWDRIQRILAAPPIRIERSNMPERYLIGYPANMPQRWTEAGRTAEPRFVFTLPDPYWYGDTSVQTQHLQPTGEPVWTLPSIMMDEGATYYNTLTTIPVGNTELHYTYNGTARTPVIVEFQRTASWNLNSFILSNDLGQSIEPETQTIGANVWAKYDSLTMERFAGVTKLSLDESDPWSLSGFDVLPGQNVWQISTTVSLSMRITAIERWA